MLFTVDVSDKEQVRRVEQALAKVLAGPPMSPEEFNALVNEALLKPKVVKKPAKRKRKPGSSQSIRAMRG